MSITSESILKQYKISFLTYSYDNLYKTVQATLDNLDLPDTVIELLQCTPELLGQTVEQALSRGTEVFICRSMNAAEFASHVIGHMVELQLTDLDYLEALHTAIRIGSRVALVLYRRLIRVPDVAAYARLLGHPVELIYYEDLTDLNEQLNSTDCDVVVGSERVYFAAQEVQKPCVLVSSTREAITRAILSARSKAIFLRQERMNQAIVRTITDNQAFGLIIQNREGIITSFSRSAEELTGLSREDALNHHFSDVLSWLNDIAPENNEAQTSYYKVRQGVRLHCYQKVIRAQGVREGTVTILIPSGKRKESEQAQRERPLAEFSKLTANSRAMQVLIAEAMKLVDLISPLMILGEPGTGRMQLAECLHNASSRKNGPFVRLNLAAIPPGSGGLYLLGAEGGEAHAEGLLAAAQGGTLVLENLSFAPPGLLENLCSLLRDGVYRPLGNATQRPVQVRLITILTPNELPTLAPSILHRLGVFQLKTPPLTERREDLKPLFVQFRAETSERQRKLDKITAQMTCLLECYDWPGNLHEMRAVVERYTILLRYAIRPTDAVRYLLLINSIGEDAVVQAIRRMHPSLQKPQEARPVELLPAIKELKQLMKYNNDQVAECLGMSRTSLWRLIRQSQPEE